MKKIINVNFKTFDGAFTKLPEECMQIDESEDIYLGSTNSYYFDKVVADELNLSNLFVQKQSLNLQDKKIYRYSNLNLPRQKVDLLKERFDIKVIRNPDKADIHVTSLQHIGNIIDHEWRGGYLTVGNFYSLCKSLKEQNVLSDDLLEKLRIKFSMMNSNDHIIKIDFPYYSSSYYTIFKALFTTAINNLENKLESKNRSLVVRKINTKAFNDILNPAATVVLDTDILNIIDEDLAVLDNDQYDQVKGMILSNDRENRTLGLEMLANCNVEKSFDLVSSLYWWHYDWLKDTTNWNSVNVKALRSRLRSYEGGHSIVNVHAYNNFIKILVQDGKLTEFLATQTREKLLNEFLGNSVGPTSDVFEVAFDNLKIKKEFNNSIND